MAVDYTKDLFDDKGRPITAIVFGGGSRVDFIAADAAAKTALTDMVAKQTCFQVDTKILYIYDGSAWQLFATLG